MSTVSGSLGKMTYETVHVFWMLFTQRSSVPMQRLLTPLNTGLQPLFVWKLLTICGGYVETRTQQIWVGGSLVWMVTAVLRQEFGDFVYMWLWEKHAVQKLMEERKNFLMVSFFLYCNMVPEMELEKKIRCFLVV